MRILLLLQKLTATQKKRGRNPKNFQGHFAVLGDIRLCSVNAVFALIAASEICSILLAQFPWKCRQICRESGALWSRERKPKTENDLLTWCLRLTEGALYSSWWSENNCFYFKWTYDKIISLKDGVKKVKLFSLGLVHSTFFFLWKRTSLPRLKTSLGFSCCQLSSA